MLIASGFEPEVMRIQEAFKAGGFKAAAQHMTDEYMDKLPVIPAHVRSRRSRNGCSRSSKRA